jgi:hypothetical protein
VQDLNGRDLSDHGMVSAVDFAVSAYTNFGINSILANNLTFLQILIYRPIVRN